MQMKTEWTQEPGVLDYLSDDLDDVLPSDLEILPDLDDLDLDEDLCLELGDLSCFINSPRPDARELRNHDCMWAGLCVNEKHERDSARSERVIVPQPQRKPLKVVAPTHNRSVLRPPPDRPDTPLSENELDLDIPALADLIEELLPAAAGPTEVTGQFSRPPLSVPTPRVADTIVANTDHCYYTTLSVAPDAIKTDNLGVQTPSDSEEEIDVETVTTDPRKPGGRSSSCGSLPTTPSLMDRHHLQLTVASAIGEKRERDLYENDRTFERRRALVRKHGGDDCDGEFEYGSRKSVKRKQYRRHKVGKCKKRRSVFVKHSGSSDSEFDSTERRSLHNVMERQRRIDLRNAFEELRVLVPDTLDNEKAAKVVILNSGAHHCQDLEHNERKLLMEKAALQRHQEYLRQEVSRLRRTLALRR